MKPQNIGLGTDIERVERFSRYQDKNDPFLKKIYSKREIEYSFKDKNYAMHLCARFCAKEACVKALYSLGIEGYFCRDFEVVNLPSGAPEIVLLNPKKGDNFTFKVSLSHCREYATSTVLVFIN